MDTSLQAAAPAPKYHILEYKYVSDILEKRTPYRAAHIDGAKKQVGAAPFTLLNAQLASFSPCHILYRS